jgi:hypothetical protein
MFWQDGDALNATNEEDEVGAEEPPAAIPTAGTANVEAHHDTKTAEVAIAVGMKRISFANDTMTIGSGT